MGVHLPIQDPHLRRLAAVQLFQMPGIHRQGLVRIWALAVEDGYFAPRMNCSKHPYR